jgi:ATP-dependent Lon protease
MAKASQISIDKGLSPTVRVAVVPVRDNVHFPGLVSTLLVGREVSLRAIQYASNRDRTVLILGQREMAVDDPSVEDMYRMGTLSEIMQVLPMPDGTMRLVLRGLSRCKVQKMSQRSGFFIAETRPVEESARMGLAEEALMREATEAFHHIATLGKAVSPESLEMLTTVVSAGQLADTIANQLSLRPESKQEILEELDPTARLESVVKLLTSERQVLELQSDLRTRVERELGNTQREYFLREQLRAIQSELSGPEEFGPEAQELCELIAAASMPEKVLEKATTELRRLDRSPISSPESMVIRTYLEWLAALPWSVTSEDRLDVCEAARILDQDHYGLSKVKDRILDFLAVRQLSHSLRGPILCFVGPPGVGKTSLGRSIAEALGRKFIRVSLGGIRDESEIRGHRRTYIGSMPGRIIEGIKQCGTRNPVCMLDEIDKMGSDHRGDPTSALLEALDPEQNTHFVDHYIDAPFDLSAVMFILTANVIENIPSPLRDRMEIISFSSYTEDEKLHIAKEYLTPRMKAEHGLTPQQLVVADDALIQAIRHYTREAGVRSLEREIATMCRKTARMIADGSAKQARINAENVGQFLGPKRHRYGTAGAADSVGAATGLAYTEFGGDILTVEVNLMPTAGEQPTVKLTGSLGEVMKESAMAAVTYVRSKQAELNPEEPFRYDVHVHVPEGAVPKDGPSAGVTIVTALVSAYTGRPVRRQVAMTGETTLRGNVLPVGGIREKALAAHRAGIRELILPAENLVDLDDLPAVVRGDLTFHPVNSISEVLQIALADATN